MSGLAVTPISTTEAVVASLREKILDGEIEPGQPLPEADLTRGFGVARPTVRRDPDPLPRRTADPRA